MEEAWDVEGRDGTWNEEKLDNFILEATAAIPTQTPDRAGEPRKGGGSMPHVETKKKARRTADEPETAGGSRTRPDETLQSWPSEQTARK